MKKIQIEKIDYEKLCSLPLDNIMSGILDKHKISGEIYLGSHKGKTIFIMGLQALITNKAEAWIYLMDKSFISAPHIIKDFLYERIKKGGYTRVQAFGDTEEEDSNRFIKWLGFEFEGTVRSYGFLGEDYHVYSIIRRE